ncbi:hypothetical protein BH11BAC3_BH11BAC3_30500 [soil metagenome]
MKNLLSIISILFFAAFNESSKVDTIQLPPENSKLVIIKLADSLGNVTMSLPIRYDTSFTWTHYSDCGKPCEKIKYRSQPKTLPITKESGWLWSGEPKDSIERFTIVHSGYFPFHDNDDTSFIFKVHEHRKADIIQSPDTYKIKSDTVEKIGNRYFSIITVDLYDTANRQFSKKLLAATSIRGNGIEFKFELLTKRKDSMTQKFMDNSIYFLRTIRLSNGK